MSQGSVEEFKVNWQRPEAEYCHFTRGEPENQIQFAFRQNWLEFAKIMEPLANNAPEFPFKRWQGRTALEVGAGRGTMSMYFADNGFDCTLLDACAAPLEQAKAQFARHGLKCETHVGDAMKLPFEDESFDVVHSYGLLEHFDCLESVLSEQARVLKTGCPLIAYVVPSSHTSYARYGDAIARGQGKSQPFRSDRPAVDYWQSLGRYCGCSAHCVYVYPLPMISGSGSFPFTLNSPEIECALVAEFKESVSDHGWLGTEFFSQAFIVWGWKK